MIHRIFTLMNTPKKSNNHLGDALKELNTAIDDWEKITSKPPREQDLSRETLEKKTKDILIKLRQQLNELSQD
jgi:hypothetical protein